MFFNRSKLNVLNKNKMITLHKLGIIIVFHEAINCQIHINPGGTVKQLDIKLIHENSAFRLYSKLDKPRAIKSNKDIQCATKRQNRCQKYDNIGGGGL